MSEALNGKRIVLGVSGSIAAYKSVNLASKLTQEGAIVDVLLTRGACQFVSPLTFRSVTHRQVLTEVFDSESKTAMEHVALATRADIMVVAPATAHTIAKLALGLADDAVSTTALATQCPLVVAPAMDGYMYENPATQENLDKLGQRGATIIGPQYGHLASSQHGWGRLLEVPELIGYIKLVLGQKGDLKGRTVVVSAGPTVEPMDPVRIVTNRSSGKMGYAIAEAARDRGARVLLVSGPSNLPSPAGVDVVQVETAQDMQKAVQTACSSADALIMAAAVSDYRPSGQASQKLKKNASKLTVNMVKNPDILYGIPHTLVKVGFAAETENLEKNAREKLKLKDLDLIVGNDITDAASGFNSETSKVLIIARTGKALSLPTMGKQSVAWHLLDHVKTLVDKRARTAQSS